MPTSEPCRKDLQTAALYEKLSPNEVHLILSQASVRTVRKGEFLFRQGEPAREMFLLECGRVRLQEVSEHGRELLVRFVRRGDVFGDRAAIPGIEYASSAVSDAAVRVYVWKSATVTALLERVPRLAVNLFGITTQYLHYARERYRLLATASVERRILWAVTDLGRSIGFMHGSTTIICGRSIQRDIGNLAGTTIYTASRILTRLERRGILAKKRGRIVLFRLPASIQHSPAK